MRVTQLCNSEGQLITIPNSTITDVSNLTRLWSRVDCSGVMAYENDPKQVLSVLQQVCERLYRKPEWGDRLLDRQPPSALTTSPTPACSCASGSRPPPWSSGSLAASFGCRCARPLRPTTSRSAGRKPSTTTRA
nr:mechanosensitive ion channel domain-containing protein [Nodosilinea sp. TSF1-S3]